jgi:hypothetical protein
MPVSNANYLKVKDIMEQKAVENAKIQKQIHQEQIKHTIKKLNQPVNIVEPYDF